MINDMLNFYDNSLLYNPNNTFLFFFIFFALILLLFAVSLVKFARLLRLALAEIRHVSLRTHKKRPYMKILLKHSIFIAKASSHWIDIIEQKVMRRIHKIVAAIAREVFISVIMIFIISAFFGVLLTPVAFAQKLPVTTYQFPWPGILPDHPLYKLKVLRNKIIAKIIYSPMKRVEFDLLMADKTLYASKLLMDQGKWELAKETALKGENYFSILVADYARVKQRNEVIPGQLRARIDQAYEAHQQLIDYLVQKAPEADKKTYQDIDFFSDENYRVLQNIDNPQPEP